MENFGEMLNRHKGVGPGFDALRIGLSIAVVAWHSIPIATGTGELAKNTAFWPLIYAIVPMFFALSGFLVTGSAQRLPITKFAINRVLRIVPALMVDTLITILIIGTLLTTVPLSEYFASTLTAKYLLNIVGHIHMLLPGVFTENAYANTVNGSLWTIPAELGCYIIMGALIVTRLARHTLALLITLFAFSVAFTVAHYTLLHFPGQRMLLEPAAKLIGFFLFGAAFFALRDKIPSSFALFTASIAVPVSAAMFGSQSWWEDPMWVILSAPAFCYIVVYLGLVKIPLPKFLRTGDYSYGIYLYAFPIQQALVQIFHITQPVVLFAMTMPPVFLLAMGSWHLVEKPALKLRKLLFRRPHGVGPVQIEPAATSPTLVVAVNPTG